MTANGLERRSPGESPAEIYQRRMVPAIFDSWVSPLLDVAALEPGERVLDLACGTGVVAREAAARVGSGHVAGLDMNPGMLALARASGAPVQWHEGNAMALPFPDDTFDVVVCQQGLQFFPDVIPALAEVRRVLVDGGRFAAATWCEIGSCPGHDALARALERHVGPEAARLMYMVFRLGDAATVESALKRAGFGDLRIRREQRFARFPSPEHFTRWLIMGSVVGRTGTTVSDEAMAAIVRDVDADLRPHVDADGLTFPMEAHIVLAVS